jgi:cytochrome P450 family 142 subfamily A polypeptide 1
MPEAIDLFDPELYRGDPHNVWTALRRHEPVYHDVVNDMWALTRHADVVEAERRSEIFSSRGCYRAYVAPQETNMIAHDDPRHTAQRRLVNRRFTPKEMKARTAEIEELIEELLEPVATAGEMEVVDALAAQLPSRLTCRMIGFPEEEWPFVKSLSERLMRIDDRHNNESMTGMIAAVGELFGRVQEEVSRRRECPADDLLTIWSTATVDGEPLDTETVLHETGLFVSGGAETTRTLISHGLRTFCDHPDQWERLAAEPELVPRAVEELLRWVTPLNNMFRTTTAATVIGGVDLPAGARVMLLYPSANRDEAVFDDPFRFDITRHPNPHVAFGNGTHFCLGAPLARHAVGLLLAALTRRFTNLRVLSEPDVEPNMFARAVRSFRLGFDRRDQQP